MATLWIRHDAMPAAAPLYTACALERATKTIRSRGAWAVVRVVASVNRGSLLVSANQERGEGTGVELRGPDCAEELLQRVLLCSARARLGSGLGAERWRRRQAMASFDLLWCLGFSTQQLQPAPPRARRRGDEGERENRDKLKIWASARAWA